MSAAPLTGQSAAGTAGPGAGAGTSVGPLDQIPPGGARAFSVGGDQVAVFRLRSGALRAVSAVCPHQGGPIADGQSDETTVLCPLHLNAFDLATGCSPTGASPLTSYHVHTDADGNVVIGAPRPLGPVST